MHKKRGFFHNKDTNSKNFFNIVNKMSIDDNGNNLFFCSTGGVPPKDRTTVEIQDSYIPRLYFYIACVLAGIGMLLLLICCGFTIVYRLRSYAEYRPYL